MSFLNTQFFEARMKKIIFLLGIIQSTLLLGMQRPNLDNEDILHLLVKVYLAKAQSVEQQKAKEAAAHLVEEKLMKGSHDPFLYAVASFFFPDKKTYYATKSVILLKEQGFTTLTPKSRRSTVVLKRKVETEIDFCEQLLDDIDSSQQKTLGKTWYTPESKQLLEDLIKSSILEEAIEEYEKNKPKEAPPVPQRSFFEKLLSSKNK